MEALGNDIINEILSPVVIITGEGDQGQNLFAVAALGSALWNGQTLYHNGCFNQEWHIKETALSSDAQLAKLMRIAPEESLFVLADADRIPALTAFPTLTEPEWLTASQDKGHLVVLTTVRGQEHLLQSATTYVATTHLQVEAGHAPYGLFITWGSGEMKERLATSQAFVPHETVLEWAKLTNGLYQAPARPEKELIINAPRSVVVVADYTDAVRSTDTPMPKHPANSFLLTRTARVDRHLQIRTTEIIGLIWLESVNKTVDEEIAIRATAWASEKWGLPLTDLKINPKTTYPDGWAQYNGCPVNIEVTKVQPRWPSGTTLAALTDGQRVGKAANPDQVPVVQCHQCGIFEVPEVNDVHALPDHDENHVWTCTYPAGMVGPDWPDPLTSLPELRIDAQHLMEQINKAADAKSAKAQGDDSGNRNWLVLVVQGFPTFEEWYEQLLHCDWQGIDGVVAILSQDFGSAIHAHYPLDTRHIVLLKCPEQDSHFCYHPGFMLEVHKGGKEMESLIEQGPDRGVTRQSTADDGTVLAEYEAVPPQPISKPEVDKGIQAAIKKLPYNLPPKPAHYWGVDTEPDNVPACPR